MKDRLEIILGKEGISRRDALRIGFTALGSLLVPEVLAGCDKGGGGSPPLDNPTPGNNNPVINTSSLPDAGEGISYSTQISASDADGDSLTYSLTQKPTGMTNSGSAVSWSNPTTGDHPVSIEVSDGKGGNARRDYTLKVLNKFDDISGRVLDILNSQPVQNPSLTEITLEELNGGGNVLTFNNGNPNYTISPNGDYVLSRVPTERKWRVKISHPDYLTHIAGFIDLTRDEAGVDFELIPDDPSRFHLAFFDEVARNPVKGDPDPNTSNKTQKWLQVPQIYIDIRSALTSTGRNGPLPTQQEIDLVESIFRNDIPGFNNGFTNSNIQIIKGTTPPNNPQLQGNIVFYWDNNSGGRGFHGEYLSGNEIIGAFCAARTGILGQSGGIGVYKQEILQTFGARDDSNLVASIFNDPLSINDVQSIDISLGKILYRRPVGNRSTTEAPDANPDTYRIR